MITERNSKSAFGALGRELKRKATVQLNKND